MRKFHTLSELQSKINPNYYSGKGASIYSDFTTYASLGRGLANACANYLLATTNARVLPVGEIGIGNGQFCIDFLSAIGGKAKITYHAYDFSEKMLDELERKNKMFGVDIETHLFDAAKGKNIDERLDYCILNELITDLPTEMVCKKKGELYDVLFTKDLKETKLEKTTKINEKLAKNMPEDYFIPLNIVGLQLLKNLMEKCKHISVFDYGFDEFYLPSDMWNLNAAREYGGQVTTDSNFIFMKNELEKHGLNVKLEKQFEFIDKHSNGKKEKMKNEKEKEIAEDDYFYHLSVSC